MDLEDLHNVLRHMMTIDALRRTYDEETRVFEEIIKQFRKILDQVAKDKKRKKNVLGKPERQWKHIMFVFFQITIKQL